MGMRSSWHLGVLAAAGFALVVVILRWSEQPSEPFVMPATSPASGTPTPMVAPIAMPENPPPAIVGIGRRDPPPPGACVFPDGTWLPPINGVKEAPPFPGFPRGGYAPVIRVYTNPDTGLQWFVHADGTHSGTQMSPYEAEGGEKGVQATWIVGTPTTPLPVR